MKTRKDLFLAIAGMMLAVIPAFSQPAVPGYVDPAISHNRLLREQMGEGVYKLIATYKVIGSSYLFGSKHEGDLFSTDATGYNIHLSYDTYNQHVEFYSKANLDRPLVKEPGTVDSFVLHADQNTGLTSPVKFVYGAHLGTSEKAYFQEIYRGPRYSVYKRYKSELGYVSDNYIQSELRQFDLIYDYFYVDQEKKSIKKIKANASSVIKEFKGVKDLSAVATSEQFFVNPNEALRNVFAYLNN